MATLFCKDLEAACVSQQCCAWDTKLQVSKKSVIILGMTFLLYYLWDLVFTPVFRPRFRLGIFGRLLSTTNPVVVLIPVTMNDLSGRHCFYTYKRYF